MQRPPEVNETAQFDFELPQRADGQPPQMYDYEFTDAALTMEDASWLEALSCREIDGAWLTSANGIIATGSIRLKRNSDPETISSVTRARREFFGQLLGWDDDNHPLHRTYQTLQDYLYRLARPSTVIHSQRLLADYGINSFKVIKDSAISLVYDYETIKAKYANLERHGLDATKVINGCPAAIRYSMKSVADKVACLEELGFDAAKIINTSPIVLKLSPERLAQKIRRLERYTRVLGWYGDASQLIKAYPAILTYSGEKLYAHARLFSIFGSPDITSSQIWQLIMTPLETHLIAIGESHITESGDYRRSLLAKISKGSSVEERAERLAGVLSAPELAVRLGSKAMVAYQKYKAPKK
jgi:hypothetical protein